MGDFSQVSLDMHAESSWSWALGLIIAAVVLLLTRNRHRRRLSSRTGVAVALFILVVAATWPAGLGRVQPGARGVLLRFGAPTGKMFGEGLFYVVPFADRVVQVNTQINTISLDRAQGTCKDLEPVYADLAISFHVVANRAIDVYRLMRDDYAQRIVYPAVADAWKATAARYSAPQLVVDRDTVQSIMSQEVERRLTRFGLAVDAVNTTRFNFAYSYAQAAQLKVASVQRTLQAQQELNRVRFEAQQSVIRAKSEVDALKLQRNIPTAELIRLRELDLQRRAIDKWDGHLPQTMGELPFGGPTLGTHRD